MSSVTVSELHIIGVLVGLFQLISAAVREGFEGGQVTLPCTGLASNQDVDWWYNGDVDQGRDFQRMLARRGSTVAIDQDTLWKDDISIVNPASLSIQSLTATRDDSQQFYCNSAVIPGQEQYTWVVVVVRAAGASIAESGNGKVVVSADISKTLTCVVTGNPKPDPRYTWTIGDQIVSSDVSRNTYDLFIIVTEAATTNGKTITCTATNYYTAGGVISSQNGTATLNVKYLGPVTVNKSSLTVTENDINVKFACNAEGNPLPHYEWRSSGELLESSSVYTIEKVLRSDAGDYGCHAINTEGNKTGNAYLMVQYPPNVSLTYDIDTHTLTCIADGVPASYTFRQWEHRFGGQFIRRLPGTSGGRDTSILQLSSVSYQDMGDYVCTVSNGIGVDQTKTRKISPKSEPQFDHQQQRFFTIDLSATADISVSFYAHPAYSKVEWTKSGHTEFFNNHKEMTYTTTLSLYDVSVAVQGTISTLILTDIKPSYEGNYTVTVTNVVNGVTHTSEFDLNVDVIVMSATSIPGGIHALTSGDNVLGPTLGAVAGVLVCVILVTVVIVWCRRRRIMADKSNDGRIGMNMRSRSETDYENADLDGHDQTTTGPLYEGLSPPVEAVYQNPTPDQPYEKLNMRNENTGGDQSHLSINQEYQNTTDVTTTGNHDYQNTDTSDSYYNL